MAERANSQVKVPTVPSHFHTILPDSRYEVYENRNMRDNGNDDVAGPPNVDEPSTSRGKKRGSQSKDTVNARRQKTKETMAEIARKRAAHFATFDEDPAFDVASNGGDNIHVGGDSARTLGPWSTAYQLAEAREDAKAKREESIITSGRANKHLGQRFDYEKWIPKQKSAVSTKDAVPRLKDRSLSLVTELIEYVESLWGIPDELRLQLAVEVCKMRRMQDDTFRLFTSHAGSWVSIPDCSYIEEEPLLQGLLEAMHPSLNALVLGLCGRGFTDSVAKSLGRDGSFANLETFIIHGAYRLTDTGCIEFLKNAKSLRTLGMPHCSRIEGSVIERLQTIAPSLVSLDISWCCGIPRTCLMPACECLEQLEALYLNGIVEIDDDFLSSGALKGLVNLQVLSLAHCIHVTDTGVKSIGSALQKLHTIVLDHCNLSSDGIKYLVDGCPRLRSVSLKRCSLLIDEDILYLINRCEIHKLYLSGLKKLTGKCVDSLVRNRSKTLEELDLSWCRKIPEEALGYLCDSCPLLEKLILWGCNHVGKDFSSGLRNTNVLIIGISDHSVLNPLECITG